MQCRPTSPVDQNRLKHKSSVKVNPRNPCPAGPTHVEHYDQTGASPPHMVIIENGTMTRTELDYVQETTRQMVIATTRHQRQLYMVFIEDDQLRELRGKIEDTYRTI